MLSFRIWKAHFTELFVSRVYLKFQTTAYILQEENKIMKCTIRHHPACNENNIIVDDMWEDTMLDNGQRFQLSCTYGICIFVFVKLSLNWIILVAFNQDHIIKIFLQISISTFLEVV